MTVKSAYYVYFGMKLGDQDKDRTPHIVYHSCVENLRQWTKCSRKKLSFGFPMIWIESHNHISDCYFCTVNLSGVKGKTKSLIEYLNIPSAIRSVPHSDSVPVPVFKGLHAPSESADSNPEDSGKDLDFAPDISADPKAPKLFTQAELNDVIDEILRHDR
ncbi:uncharacterized protein LOC143240882 [Tachypleus tridentatus]|uniref:uncharacterized protein LOC143240882 n=1 Tax=Tachypleus tridentatus TaxID=6853 RepID=UPI003FD24026